MNNFNCKVLYIMIKMEVGWDRYITRTGTWLGLGWDTDWDGNKYNSRSVFNLFN